MARDVAPLTHSVSIIRCHAVHSVPCNLGNLMSASVNGNREELIPGPRFDFEAIFFCLPIMSLLDPSSSLQMIFPFGAVHQMGKAYSPSQGVRLATAGDDGRVIIWSMGPILHAAREVDDET